MHTHERTMLAKLGFADPDRQVPLHELACQYLATPDAVQRLVRCLAIERAIELHKEEFSNEEQVSRAAWNVRSHRLVREREIAKGMGQYRTTVGFADLVLQLHVEEQHSEVWRRTRNAPDGRGNRTWTQWRAVDDQVLMSQEEIGIEVKATPIAISDVIRQVKLYRSYSGVRTWVVATTYQMARPDLECLQNEKLRHVHLGSHFQTFVADQLAANPVVNMEV